jgi:methylmalonyl-CoA/ethylmalonyl-CoA epimerase
LYRKIDHIGIAVQSLERTLKIYEGSLALRVERMEEVADQQVRVAILPVGESRVELLEATADDSPIARFLARRGEGLHHICFQVDSVMDEIRKLKAAGVRLIDEMPRAGADGSLVAFIHPSGTGGVLIELSQPGFGDSQESR